MTQSSAKACRTVHLGDIRVDDAIRSRIELDSDTVEAYALALREGVVLPPVLLFDADSELLLVDGSHRLEAHRRAGFVAIVAEVRVGTRDDATWASCGANHTHGLRRSNADKQRSITRALLHPRGMRLSDRQIARHCGVHHESVSRIRTELERDGRLRRVSCRLVERSGTVYEQTLTRAVDPVADRLTMAKQLLDRALRQLDNVLQELSTSCVLACSGLPESLDDVALSAARIQAKAFEIHSRLGPAALAKPRRLPTELKAVADRRTGSRTRR